MSAGMGGLPAPSPAFSGSLPPFPSDAAKSENERGGAGGKNHQAATWVRGFEGLRAPLRRIARAMERASYDLRVLRQGARPLKHQGLGGTFVLEMQTGDAKVWRAMVSRARAVVTEGWLHGHRWQTGHIVQGQTKVRAVVLWRASMPPGKL